MKFSFNFLLTQNWALSHKHLYTNHLFRIGLLMEFWPGGSLQPFTYWCVIARAVWEKSEVDISKHTIRSHLCNSSAARSVSILMRSRAQSSLHRYWCKSHRSRLRSFPCWREGSKFHLCVYERAENASNQHLFIYIIFCVFQMASRRGCSYSRKL